MFKNTITIAAAIAATALFTGPVAHADVDSDYVAALNAGGIRITLGNTGAAIRLAHHICDHLHNGSTPKQEALIIYNENQQPPNPLIPEAAMFIVNTSVAYYCPALSS
jgi:hypothetical protein